MEFCQELSNSIWGNCEGDSRGHLECIYANHITILAREEPSLGLQVMQTDRCKTKTSRGESEASHWGSEHRGARGKRTSTEQRMLPYRTHSVVGKPGEGGYLPMCKSLLRTFFKFLSSFFSFAKLILKVNHSLYFDRDKRTGSICLFCLNETKKNMEKAKRQHFSETIQD